MSQRLGGQKSSKVSALFEWPLTTVRYFIPNGIFFINGPNKESEVGNSI